jgi:ATP-dependent Clp endopeptidase proteolytic subunit ClpP
MIESSVTPDDLVRAEIAKLAAETAEIEAGMKRADAAAALRFEMLGLKHSNLLAETEMTQVALRKALRDERLLLCDWRFDHTLNFVGHVAKDTVAAAIERLHQFSVADPGCDITIVFNSPGGSVIDGMALFDYIRSLSAAGHKVTTVALGYAASMGGILLQAGDVRAMAKGAWLMIHEVAFSTGGKIGEIEDMYRFGERLKEQAATIFVERSGGVLTREHLEKNWNRKDWWISSDEALELNLVDEVR